MSTVRHGVATGGAAAPVLPAGATRRSEARAYRIECAVLLAITVLPLVGALGGIAMLAQGRLTCVDHAVFAALYLATGLGITAGYHRLFAHRAFRTGPVLRALLAVAGAMAIQGPVLRWVADHRRHHGHTDHDGDPHSPWHGSPDDRVSLRGLWHAHTGWFFARDKTVVRRFAADLVLDPIVTRVDRLYPLWMLLSVAVPGGLGLLLDGTGGAARGLVWGGLTRIFVVQHVTWSINSIAHAFGTRRFATPDRSRNNRVLAWLALGEGLHNNHHAFPRAAIQSIADGEVDVTGLVLRGFESLGLARDLHRPDPERVARRAHDVAATRSPALAASGHAPRDGGHP